MLSNISVTRSKGLLPDLVWICLAYVVNHPISNYCITDTLRKETFASWKKRDIWNQLSRIGQNRKCRGNKVFALCKNKMISGNENSPISYLRTLRFWKFPKRKNAKDFSRESSFSYSITHRMKALLDSIGINSSKWLV